MAKSHGKVMEFDKQIFKIQLMCMSIKRSWNFVIRSWKSHGILSRQFRGNPATPDGDGMSLKICTFYFLHISFTWLTGCTRFTRSMLSKLWWHIGICPTWGWSICPFVGGKVSSFLWNGNLLLIFCTLSFWCFSATNLVKTLCEEGDENWHFLLRSTHY